MTWKDKIDYWLVLWYDSVTDNVLFLLFLDMCQSQSYDVFDDVKRVVTSLIIKGSPPPPVSLKQDDDDDDHGLLITTKPMLPEEQ